MCFPNLELLVIHIEYLVLVAHKERRSVVKDKMQQLMTDPAKQAIVRTVESPYTPLFHACDSAVKQGVGLYLKAGFPISVQSTMYYPFTGSRVSWLSNPLIDSDTPIAIYI